MYRDDLEASNARVLALEQEVEQLCTRVAELELDNTRLRDELRAVVSPIAPPVRRGARRVTIRVSEQDNERELVFDDALITIGGAGSHVQIDDHREVHALLANSNENLVLADAGTPTGTYVNGEEIKIRTLREGDQIVIGGARLTIRW
ncbi:MAG: Inner rane component of cytoplasmic domain [Deltaproteobacteria bacterium]|nr:Inner rane component of cytoplasmic domain [Deltaproteobacteria bacterium]